MQAVHGDNACSSLDSVFTYPQIRKTPKGRWHVWDTKCQILRFANLWIALAPKKKDGKFANAQFTNCNCKNLGHPIQLDPPSRNKVRKPIVIHLPVIWKKENKRLFFCAHMHTVRPSSKIPPLSPHTLSITIRAPLYWPYLRPWMESEDDCSIHLIVDCLALLLVIRDWHCDERLRS